MSNLSYEELKFNQFLPDAEDFIERYNTISQRSQGDYMMKIQSRFTELRHLMTKTNLLTVNLTIKGRAIKENVYLYFVFELSEIKLKNIQIKRQNNFVLKLKNINLKLFLLMEKLSDIDTVDNAY